MKYLLGFLTSMALSSVGYALPVMNENVANSGVMTIFPDSSEVHRFYVAPNIVMIAKTDHGLPVFAYTEYRKSLFQKVGVITMVLGATYTRDELAEAEAGISKKDPLAEFSGLPFIDSSLDMTGTLPELIADNQCNHQAGLIGQEQSCTMVLTSKGRALFLKALERKALFITLQFNYSVQGVVKKADGSFADQLIQHGIAVRIDGGQLLDSHAAIIR